MSEKRFQKAIIRVLAIEEDGDGKGDRIYCLSIQWNYRYAFSWLKSEFPEDMQPLLKPHYRFFAEVDFLSSDEIERFGFPVKNFEIISQEVPSWEELSK